MDVTAVVVAVVTAAGSGAGIKVLVDIFTGRGKRKIEQTASLTAATSEVLEIVRAQRDDFQRRMQAEADNVEHVRAELSAARSELQEARDEIRDIRARFDRFVSDESAWAAKRGLDDAPVMRLVK